MVRCSFVALLAAACGGGNAKPPPPNPVTTVTAPEPEPTEPEASVAPAPRPGPGFADSPITPLAREVVAVAQAALRGEPLPQVSFGIEPPSADVPLVHEQGKKTPRDLQFIAFAMDLEIALAPPPTAPANAPGGNGAEGLETMLYLSQHGLKLLSLKPDTVSDTIAAPRWLPVAGLVKTLLADIRTGRMQGWWIGDADKAMLGPELTREIQREAPGDSAMKTLEQRWDESTTAHGYRLDDIVLVARDPSGTLWGAKLQFESGEPPELDSRPLVRLRPVDDD